MPDPELLSVHLEGDPRRERFRLARALVRAACGDRTLAGPPVGPAAPGFFLRDGEHLHELAVGVNRVGRLPDNDVVIPDRCVSRRHCAVVVHGDGRAEVHDIASKNGTELNGRKIAGPTRLAPGDQLTLSAHSVLFLTAAGDGAG